MALRARGHTRKGAENLRKHALRALLDQAGARGRYTAEVNVEIIETGGVRSPDLSFEDVHTLGDVRDALGRGDVEAASRLGHVFTPARASA